MADKPTVVDVAKRAGVSPGTVSKALSGRGSKTVRSKVKEAVHELGYRPNLFARAMRSPLKNCIGILVSAVSENDPWLEKILPTMAAVISESGYRCVVDFWKGDAEEAPIVLDSVDGCILLGNYPDDFFRMVERDYGLPLVTVSEKMPYSRGVSLQVDWGAAMHEVVQYLLAYQHRRIGLVVVGTYSPSLKARYEGYMEAMHHFGRELDESLIATAPGGDQGPFGAGRLKYLIDTSEKLTEQILQGRRRPTAIVFGTDRSAFGGLLALRKAGLRVPEDVSIAAFDNTDWGSVMTPAITSAGVDYRDLSLHLIEVLEGFVGTRKRMPAVKLRPELAKRESVVVAPDAE